MSSSQTRREKWHQMREDNLEVTRCTNLAPNSSHKQLIPRKKHPFQKIETGYYMSSYDGEDHEAGNGDNRAGFPVYGSETGGVSSPIPPNTTVNSISIVQLRGDGDTPRAESRLKYKLSHPFDFKLTFRQRKGVESPTISVQDNVIDIGVASGHGAVKFLKNKLKSVKLKPWKPTNHQSRGLIGAFVDGTSGSDIHDFLNTQKNESSPINTPQHSEDYHEHLIHYTPMSYHETATDLNALSHAIFLAAYNLEPLINVAPSAVLKPERYPHASKHVQGYDQILRGNNISHQIRAFGIAAIISEFLWIRIYNGALFTEKAKSTLEKVAKAPYSNDEEGKLVEQRLATQMQRDHGAGGNLIKHSDAWDVVQTEIKTLVDEFDESKQNPEVFQLLEKMGSQVWKSAINLRNQKGSILFTFSPENTRDIIESLDSVGIVWFPQVTINKPRHAYDRSTHEQEVVSEVHEALHAPHPHSSKRLTRHTRELDNLLEVGLLHPKPIPNNPTSHTRVGEQATFSKVTSENQFATGIGSSEKVDSEQHDPANTDGVEESAPSQVDQGTFNATGLGVSKIIPGAHHNSASIGVEKDAPVSIIIQETQQATELSSSKNTSGAQHDSVPEDVEKESPPVKVDHNGGIQHVTESASSEKTSGARQDSVPEDVKKESPPVKVDHNGGIQHVTESASSEKTSGAQHDSVPENVKESPLEIVHQNEETQHVTKSASSEKTSGAQDNSVPENSEEEGPFTVLDQNPETQHVAELASPEEKISGAQLGSIREGVHEENLPARVHQDQETQHATELAEETQHATELVSTGEISGVRHASALQGVHNEAPTFIEFDQDTRNATELGSAEKPEISDLRHDSAPQGGHKEAPLSTKLNQDTQHATELGSVEKVASEQLGQLQSQTYTGAEEDASHTEDPEKQASADVLTPETENGGRKEQEQQGAGGGAKTC